MPGKGTHRPGSEEEGRGARAPTVVFRAEGALGAPFEARVEEGPESGVRVVLARAGTSQSLGAEEVRRLKLRPSETPDDEPVVLVLLSVDGTRAGIRLRRAGEARALVRSFAASVNARFEAKRRARGRKEEGS